MAGVLVKSLSQRECFTIEGSATVLDAANKLTKHNIGAMPVLDSKANVIGIISERDISRYLSSKSIKLDSSITSIMSTNIISCNLKISVSELMETMTNKKIRHMPINDQG